MQMIMRLAGLLAVVAALTAPVAAAATPTTVRLPPCLNGSGQRTVPAGSDVTIASAWVSNRGSVEQFLRSVTVTLAVDGTPMSDANSYFSEPFRVDNPSFPGTSWRTEWQYHLGVLASAGDQFVVTFSWYLDKRIVVVDEPSASFIGPGEMFVGDTCTITAA